MVFDVLCGHDSTLNAGELFHMAGQSQCEAFVSDFGPEANKKLKEWGRTSYYCHETGEVYLPAIAAGNELDVVLCAAHDGVGMITSDGHSYVPASWLAKEYPKWASTFLKAAKDIRKAAKTPPAASS